MHRMELFEIRDHLLFPVFLRDLTTLDRVGTREILDLCSGGGGPWFRLVRDLESEHDFSISVCLTDKYPNKEAFERALSSSSSEIGFDPRPVEATEVPADLGGFRTIFSSFHHFRATDAREVLANAVERRKGIAIFETARRAPKTVLAICFIPILVLFLTPQIRPFRWSRLLWTFVLPLVSFVLWFDGWMSCLRSYSHEELSELVRSLSCETYRWELGTQSDGFLPVTYLIGSPASSQNPSEAYGRAVFPTSSTSNGVLAKQVCR